MKVLSLYREHVSPLRFLVKLTRQNHTKNIYRILRKWKGNNFIDWMTTYETHRYITTCLYLLLGTTRLTSFYTPQPSNLKVESSLLFYWGVMTFFEVVPQETLGISFVPRRWRKWVSWDTVSIYACNYKTPTKNGTSYWNSFLKSFVNFLKYCD